MTFEAENPGSTETSHHHIKSLGDISMSTHKKHGENRTHPPNQAEGECHPSVRAAEAIHHSAGEGAAGGHHSRLRQSIRHRLWKLVSFDSSIRAEKQQLRVTTQPNGLPGPHSAQDRSQHGGKSTYLTAPHCNLPRVPGAFPPSRKTRYLSAPPRSRGCTGLCLFPLISFPSTRPWLVATLGEEAERSGRAERRPVSAATAPPGYFRKTLRHVSGDRK